MRREGACLSLEPGLLHGEARPQRVRDKGGRDVEVAHLGDGRANVLAPPVLWRQAEVRELCGHVDHGGRRAQLLAVGELYGEIVIGYRKVRLV